MSHIAIRAENLSKQYQIGQKVQYKTLRDVLVDTARAPFRYLHSKLENRNPTVGLYAHDNFIWALKDVSFEISVGEVVGIIGSNGAGKSTLLKLLARITSPTSGYAEIFGRVSSLLEVGTGFHPELTGRENVFLNGAILGMKRNEIIRKFDEIVEFAEVESFIDTPVKYYSSGMYVRLAFSVAAHLETEILFVDEVLAVGDAAFQKKCLGKMGQIAKIGRTVLFVSHNMGTINSLCQTAMQINQGHLVGKGPAREQVSHYLEHLAESACKPLHSREDREGSGAVQITSLRILDGFGRETQHVLSGEDALVAVGFSGSTPHDRLTFALSCFNISGEKLFHVDTVGDDLIASFSAASGEVICRLVRLPLPAGRYFLNAMIKRGDEIVDHLYSAGVLNVLPGDYYRRGQVSETAGGLFFVDNQWSTSLGRR